MKYSHHEQRDQTSDFYVENARGLETTKESTKPRRLNKGKDDLDQVTRTRENPKGINETFWSTRIIQ